jgi:hypothetical protein
MLYLKQDFNISPASPETRDRFVALAEASLVSACERLGGRVVGAWFSNAEWFSQITQVIELDDFKAFDSFRREAADDGEWQECQRQIEELAPERRESLLEPAGPIPPSTLHDAIESARSEPVGAHSLAILEVAQGRMKTFHEMLVGAKDGFPIVACWRSVAGNPNEIIDVWKGALGQDGYKPSDDATNAFFQPLRKIAPRERLVTLYPLPYSPLK